MRTIYRDRYIEVYEADERVYVHAAGDAYTIAGWPDDRVADSLAAALTAIMAEMALP